MRSATKWYRRARQVLQGKAKPHLARYAGEGDGKWSYCLVRGATVIWILPVVANHSNDALKPAARTTCNGAVPNGLAQQTLANHRYGVTDNQDARGEFKLGALAPESAFTVHHL